VSRIRAVDLHHGGLEGAIASYLILDPEPTLVDPGPATTLPTLLDALEEAGMAGELRHLCLTHIHLDHAGATGHLVERLPRATVHVHEEGVRHLVDPERLVSSTRRTFGDAHDRLWGEVRPVPSDRIRGWSPGSPGPWAGLRPLATPGHIGHHLSYLDEESGTLLAGDALGIVLAPEAPTHPPTPPPAVDLPAWYGTLDRLAELGAERFGAAHFGLHDDPAGRARELARALHHLEARVQTAMDAGNEEDAQRYEEEVRAGLAPWVGRERVDRYFDTFAAATDWAGVRFHLERRS